MTKIGKGRYSRRNGRSWIYIPADVTKDSTFPFNFNKGDVKVTIEDDKLIIEEYVP